MILAVMPCKGRIDQTLAVIPRLLATAGLPRDAWQLICVVDDDEALMDALRRRPDDVVDVDVIGSTGRNGYWRSVRNGLTWSRATYPLTEFTHVVNLANDLLPGKDWLKRALAAHQAAFGGGEGVMGFNDGIYMAEHHAAHFLASVRLLRRWYGDDYVPLCYDHMYGDAEINLRAKAERKLASAPWAVLYHNHLYVGAEQDDVYRAGHAHYAEDEARFHYRRTHDWTDPQEAPHVLRPETRTYELAEN